MNFRCRIYFCMLCVRISCMCACVHKHAWTCMCWTQKIMLSLFLKFTLKRSTRIKHYSNFVWNPLITNYCTLGLAELVQYCVKKKTNTYELESCLQCVSYYNILYKKKKTTNGTLINYPWKVVCIMYEIIF